MTSTIAIDVNALPSSSTSTSWESPHRCVTQLGGGGPTVIGPFQPTTSSGKALKQLSVDFERMVQANPSIESVQIFLRPYSILDRSRSQVPRIHPLVLEWFDHRDILAVAVEMKRDDIARYLLDEGFAVSGDAIHAMRKRSSKLAKWAIEQGKWDVNQPISETLPPILASFVKNKEMLRWLLAHGADPTLASLNGKYTILHCAAQYATIPCLSLLLAAAPNAIMPGSPSTDVVFHATTSHSSKNNRMAIIHYLLDNGAPIDMVAGCGKYEDQEAPFIDLLAYGRKTALHWAVEHGQVDVVEALLDRGADARRKTWSLATKMKWVSIEELAMICGQHAVTEALISYAIKKETDE